MNIYVHISIYIYIYIYIYTYNIYRVPGPVRRRGVRPDKVELEATAYSLQPTADSLNPSTW